MLAAKYPHTNAPARMPSILACVALDAARVALFAVVLTAFSLLMSGCMPRPEPLAFLDQPPFADAKGSLSRLSELSRRHVQTALMDGIDPSSLVAQALPSADAIMAMLSTSSMVDRFEDNEEEAHSPFTVPRYQRIASYYEVMRRRRSELEAYLDGAWPVLSAWDRLFASKKPQKRYVLTKPGLHSLPRRDQLEYSHTWALDIFLQDVQQLPDGTQKGPIIYSLSDGIVVAASSNWRGYPRFNASVDYLWGGLSPKAGNGVIVYSPSERRYYLYFHLYNAFVVPGQAVRRGSALGFSGNSGINARRKGRGEHLHLEIFNAANGRFFSNEQILAMLSSASRTSIFTQD